MASDERQFSESNQPRLDFELDERSEYNQRINIIMTILSKMSEINPPQRSNINDIVLGLVKNHNNFNQSARSIDLIPIIGHMQTIQTTIDIGRLDHLFALSENRLLLKDEFYAASGYLQESAERLSARIDADNHQVKALAVPSEIPAPIRVGIVDNRISLINKQSHVGSIDYAAANRIRKSLLETFVEIIDDLPSSSNADQRFVRACTKLLSYLNTPMEEVSIESFGLNYQLVTILNDKLASEIGGSVVEEISHTLTGIGVLLNQFQEWRDYLDELAITQLGSLDSMELVRQAKSLSEQINSHKDLVDTKISERLMEMVEPVISGLINADTVAVPLIGSLSNFFGLLSKISIDFISTAPQTGIAATFGASALLLSYAVNTLKEFCPIICQFQPLKFVLGIVQWITSRYSQSKDVGLGII